MRTLIISILAASLALCGCKRNGPMTDAQEDKNPLIKEGKAFVELKDWEQAEASFKKAIESNPCMAQPYLELANIYHDKKPDYISAIYHYKKYKELRPESDKIDLVNDQIKKVQGTLTDIILKNTGAMQAIQEYQQLQKENSALQQQVSQFKQQAEVVKKQLADQQIQAVKQSATTKPTTADGKTTAAQPTQDQAPTADKPGIHHVTSGETLSKIAKKYYNDSSKAELIYQANKSSMKSAGDLRIGQTIVIPFVAK